MHRISGRTLFIATLCIFLLQTIQAQNLSYGFKAGLNSNKFSGPTTNETYESNIGFHIGVIFKYEITDLFGLKGEFMYSQKGSDYVYNGPSQFLIRGESESVLASGTRNMNVTISNDYIDFPVMGYGKFGPVELNLGFSVGFLAGSTGGGQMRFTGTDPIFDELSFNLDHRYYGDEVGDAQGIEVETVTLAGTQYRIPRQHGAYYEYNEKEGSRYRPLDIGLIAGANFYLNDGLYLGVRGNFGLIDVTRPSVDITYGEFENNAPKIQDDVDKQVSIQFSLGFSF